LLKFYANDSSRSSYLQLETTSVFCLSKMEGF
jgi:hypothetical protein